MKRTLPFLGAAAAVAAAAYLLVGPQADAPPAMADIDVMAQAQDATADNADNSAAATDDSASLEDKGYVVGDVVLGDENAPVTIIEYASLTCPHCAAFANNTLPTLKSEYIDTGKAKLILREVYFDQYGLWASAVARCGGADRFYPFVDVFYAKQHDWAGAPDQDAIVNEIRRIGRLGGLSQARVDQCLSDQPFVTKLLQDYQAHAEADDVRSTPHFLINGQVIKGNQPLSEFQAAIDAHLGG